MTAPISDEDRQTALELWVDLGRQPMSEPTPEQLLAFLRRCPDGIGVERLRRMIIASREAMYCWVADHDAELHALRQLLSAERERVKKMSEAVERHLGVRE